MSALVRLLVLVALYLLGTDAFCQAPFGFHFVRTDEYPSSALYDQPHQRFFVAVPGRNEVDVVSEQDGSVASVIKLPNPTEMDLSPDGARLYVTSQDAEGFFVVDTSSLQVADFIQPTQTGIYLDGNTFPHYIAAMRNGKILYVAAMKDQTSGTLFEYDPATRIAAVLNVCYEPMLMKSADSSRLVIACMGVPNLAVYDGDSDAIAGWGGPGPIVVTADSVRRSLLYFP